MSSIAVRSAVGLEELTESGVIAILRGGSGKHVVETGDALVRAGITSLEVTTNTPGWQEGVRLLSERWAGTAHVGVGTVRDPSHVEISASLGAEFIVCPHFDRELGKAAIDCGLAWLPGAATPTEISEAWAFGATAVKVFPIVSLGGPGFLSNVRAPLDDIPLIPTGGIGLSTVGDYIMSGAVAVGLGGPLMGHVLDDGDISSLTTRANSAIEGVLIARETISALNDPHLPDAGN